MTLAKLAGLDAANVELTRIGMTRALIIERFDRSYIEDRDVVQRKHVIDGCQATDLPPGYKYERQNEDEGDGVYMRVDILPLLSRRGIPITRAHAKLL